LAISAPIEGAETVSFDSILKASEIRVDLEASQTWIFDGGQLDDSSIETAAGTGLTKLHFKKLDLDKGIGVVVPTQPGGIGETTPVFVMVIANGLLIQEYTAFGVNFTLITKTRTKDGGFLTFYHRIFTMPLGDGQHAVARYYGRAYPVVD